MAKAARPALGSMCAAGLLLALASAFSGCASNPVREYEENTKRVVSEQPVLGGR